MKNLKFLVLEGDGIGPEIVKASINVLQAALKKFDMSVDLIYEDIGFVSLKKHKTTFRQEILKIGEECDGIILGTCSHNDYPPTNEGGLNPSGVIRK